MENDKKAVADPTLHFGNNDEITRAYQRAVREAVLRHKRNGNPIAISRNGKVVIVQPDEIEAELERAYGKE